MLVMFVLPPVPDLCVGLVTVTALTHLAAWTQWRYYKKAL